MGLVKTVYFWPGLEEAFAQVYKVLKVCGTFLICNEFCGKNQADEKWAKMIEGMVIYTAEQIKRYLEKAAYYYESGSRGEIKVNGWRK